MMRHACGLANPGLLAVADFGQDVVALIAGAVGNTPGVT
jgi:hypothetical protein